MTQQMTRSGAQLEKLLEIMKKLRSDQGCPWDREQTHQSLKPCAVEETYEVLEAIDLGDQDKLREELGDLLLQVVFHAQLAAEEGHFTMDEVIAATVEKLIRRHPHVFGGATVNGVAGVLETWEQIKKTELKEERLSALDGIPKGLPSLQRAEKLQNKAAKVGFDWKEWSGPWAKVKEELAEFEEVLGQPDDLGPGSPAWRRLEEEFGDLLFSLVNLGRFFDIQAEMALNRTNAKFIRRFQEMEREAARQGQTLPELTLTQQEALWQKAKSVDREEG